MESTSRPALYSSLITFNLNHRLFLNCLAGITDENAKQRISDHNNPLIWVATHTVWARFNIVGLLGNPVENPFKGMFEGFKPFEPTMVFPTIAELKTNWNEASALIKDAIQNVSADHLKMDAPFKNPTEDLSMEGAIIFLAQHESYDIGQMAFLKKYITGEAMSYS